MPVTPSSRLCLRILDPPNEEDEKKRPVVRSVHIRLILLSRPSPCRCGPPLSFVLQACESFEREKVLLRRPRSSRSFRMLRGPLSSPLFPLSVRILHCAFTILHSEFGCGRRPRHVVHVLRAHDSFPAVVLCDRSVLCGRRLLCYGQRPSSGNRQR